MGEQRTLGRLAEVAWNRFDDYESLFFEGSWHRSQQLAGRARRACGGFTELGVRPGDRVVVMMANCPEVGITYQALWRAGAAITPVMFLVSPEELRHILLDSGARVVVTTTEVLPKVQAGADGLDVRIVLVGEETTGTIPFSQLDSGPEGPLVDRAEDDLAALMYTGGTTGRAKGVMLTHAGLYSAAGRRSEQGQVSDPPNRSIVPLPLSHAYGLIVTLIGMHSELPRVSVLMRWFDAAQWQRLAAEHRAQIGPLVPAMIQMLLADPGFGATPLPDLRYVTSGAAPLPREALDEFERRLPGVEILEGYGMTETSAIISSNPPGARRLGSVGLPIPGYQVVIRDDEGRELPPGTDGEICVTSESVMRGYWNADEATVAAMPGGELRTGDIGHLDEDGYLYVVDRKKDLIIRNGFNVFPRDVEDALTEHPDVTMAGVVGRPDPRLGEEVVAFVSLAEGSSTTSADLVGWMRDRIGQVKYPREVHVVDAVPVTSVFKTDRKRLRKMLDEYSSS
ncbi:acyl-CoA synthetase [Actinomadura craniellae]|uniref:Acyl-CoA synthetase n=1 Tax=Actinomadura craniellae TaxID=2231787 RepID=A0A365H8R2_9ACTN|nr:AMP-binding protein [Actinomadura craniellae]RAY15495.1 acyl-CoA synthetase [Actinomadura craniellae]